ncbi:hypothetical protein GUJ93_ZPchr0002g23509 [Zizania palustris]|uniref:Uncharacterized protein n=1 Tax=Zizania palustris TaxID=103762 RepID=A0A8J5VVL7_ZIZPA|nr:hypothetical protein GUJ93_ZPchr0002g23509 [Zizania palustris]
MGRPSSTRGGGDDDALDSPPLPPIPARPRPTPRARRRPSRPQRVVLVRTAGPRTTTPPAKQSLSSPLQEEEDGGDIVAAMVEELERKAAMAEAQLRQEEEENASLRRKIESYHVRWLQYEIRLRSLQETFHEQMAASLHMAQGSAERSRVRHGISESGMTMSSEDTPTVRLRHGGRDRVGVVVRRSATSTRQHRQPLVESDVIGPRPGQQPAGAPSDDSINDLEKLKSQFGAWKKDYKARLRKVKAEVDSDRRRRSGCWI